MTLLLDVIDLCIVIMLVQCSDCGIVSVDLVGHSGIMFACNLKFAAPQLFYRKYGFWLSSTPFAPKEKMG